MERRSCPKAKFLNQHPHIILKPLLHQKYQVLLPPACTHHSFDESLLHIFVCHERQIARKAQLFALESEFDGEIILCLN